MYSEPKAQRVIRFIECLRHTKGEFHGKPFKLLPWQEKIIKDVFGIALAALGKLLLPDYSQRAKQDPRVVPVAAGSHGS